MTKSQSNLSDSEEEYFSSSEKFFGEVFAPRLVSIKGRIATIVIWTLMSAASLYGMMSVETNFSATYFIPDGTPSKQFLGLMKKYYDFGLTPAYMILNVDIDFVSEEV